MYLTFFDGHMNVVVRLAERFANITHWPSPRAIYAVQFINAWEAQHPWLTFVRGVTTGPDDPTTLFASLSLAKWRFHVTEHDYVRIHRWLRYEVDAFENALDKLRSRKTAMTGRRAADLAQKRLARHVRPDKGLVTSSARSNSTEFLLAFRTIQESGILLARD